MNLERVLITKIINGGYGVGRLGSGQLALTRHVLPGEIVTVIPEETRKNYIFAKVYSIEGTHPSRRNPPCRYYQQCGGCDLQHCDYGTQLSIKNGIAIDLLRRQNDDEVDLLKLLPKACLAAPGEWAYRQRIRLQVGEQGEIGFHRHRSHDIVPVNECLLAGPALNRTLSRLRSDGTAKRLVNLSSLVELQLNPLNHQVVCIFSLTRRVRPKDIISAKNFCRESDTTDCVFFKGADFPLCGPYGRIDEDNSAGGFGVHYPADEVIPRAFKLNWETGGFCQVNLDQNRNLIKTVLDLSRVTASETVLDLYCGMGNFSIPLAMMAKSVIGFEGQGSAIRSARRNAELAGLHNTSFFKTPIHIACGDLARSGTVFDCVVLDPPRGGAPDLADNLARICRRRMVYISCDPATLSRDLHGLCRQGFTIETIQPIDMFPQTHHIETVVLLDR